MQCYPNQNPRIIFLWKESNLIEKYKQLFLKASDKLIVTKEKIINFARNRCQQYLPHLDVYFKTKAKTSQVENYL